METHNFQARARVRVRKKRKKKREIGGNALSGRFDAMFDCQKNNKRKGNMSRAAGQLFSENGRTSLDFSPFGSILLPVHFFCAGVAKWLCSSFPSWLRRFDSGRPLHFFCPDSGFSPLIDDMGRLCLCNRKRIREA